MNQLVVVILLIFSPVGSSLLHRRLLVRTQSKVQGDQGSAPVPLPEQWFHQKLDHFNPADNRYWQQRYFVNDTFYIPGGPAFLFIGAEASLYEIYTRSGAWMEYAKEYHAIGFAVEHRHYGKSRPTANLSTSNLQYLTVEQALEDLAAFIMSTNKEHNLTDTKWVTFGGSYGGMLSAWMRYKFPHLVAGAVADSAPVDVKTTAPEYTVGMGEDLRTVPGCYEAMTAAFVDIRNKLQSDAETKRLKELFGFCDFNRSKRMDVENVMLTLIAPVIGATQYSDDHREYLHGGYQEDTVSSMCSVLTDKTRGDPLMRFADFSTLNFTYYAKPCYEVSFDSLLSAGKDLRFDDNVDPFTDRQFMYQMCTQIGLAYTTETDNQPFGRILSAEYQYQICSGYFGPEFTSSLMSRGVNEILMNYGGLDIQATNVVYTQGSYDPWKHYGFTKVPIPRTHVIVMNGVGHVADLYSSSPLDKPSLTQARAKIQRYIGQWITSSGPGLLG